MREDSYAEKVAGEARTFRHPPSPLQDEVNLVLKASTWLMIPLAVVLIFALQARSTPLHEAAQTATAGLITLIPEGLVLLMSVTLAVAAVRLARLDTLVQQMSATEALAAVDTICVDKTGTLTSGELELVSVDVSDPSEASSGPAGAGPLRRQLRRAQPDARGDRRELPGDGRAGPGRGALLLGVEVERAELRARRDLRARRARRPDGPWLARPSGAAPAQPRGEHEGRAPRRRLRPRLGRAAGQPLLGPAARGDAHSLSSCSRRRSGPTPARRFATCASARWT